MKIFSLFTILLLVFQSISACYITPAYAGTLADGQQTMDNDLTLSFSSGYEEVRELEEVEVKKYYPLLANLTLLKLKTNLLSLSTNYYLYSDHLSSTSLVYDDQGEVVENHAYTPYGEIMPATYEPEQVRYRVNNSSTDSAEPFDKLRIERLTAEASGEESDSVTSTPGESLPPR